MDSGRGASRRASGARSGFFSPHELSSVIALLFTAQRQDNHGDPVVEARLFVSKGCERCHAPRSAGRSAGPPLDELKRSSSPMFLDAVMWNHGRYMEHLAKRRAVVLPTFTAQEWSDITRYLAGLGSGAPVGLPRPK